MDFVEEKTPSGNLLKIFLQKWQFLVFDKKGSSIYIDREGTSPLHRIPLMVFIGRNFQVKRDYSREYSLVKVRKGVMIIPYQDLQDRKTKYIFIFTDKRLDLMPVRIISVPGVADMVKEIDVSMNPEYIIVDRSVTLNDIVVIKNRYKINDVIHLEQANNYSINEGVKYIQREESYNLNVMSNNPVYLAGIHLKSMDLSSVNQLLLDFDLTALETEFILSFIDKKIKAADESLLSVRNRPMLQNLKTSFTFYLDLLQQKHEEIEAFINAIDERKNLASFRTLVRKVKSMHPGKQEQDLYFQYEKLIIEKQESLS